jgi:hypothetical protein
MRCTKLCTDLGFGNKTYVKGAKHCLGCELFIITDSPICACCGSTLGYTIATPPDYRGFHKFIAQNFGND